MVSPARVYVRIAADSTMLRMVNRLMALSLGVHLEQLEHRMGLTWPRPVRNRVSDDVQVEVEVEVDVDEGDE